MNNENVTSVDKVFAIIEVLANYPNGCSLTILAEETQLNKSTVHRFLKTLKSLGYVALSTVMGNYRLAFKIANIGQRLIYETNIVQLAIPELIDLRNITKKTVNLKHFQQQHEIIVFKLEPKSGNFRTRAYIGQTSPLYYTATGKVFLAHREKQFVQDYWTLHKDTMRQITKATILDVDKFLQECDVIKKCGYAFDNEENEMGISCIAAPIFNIMGNVEYAVSISMQSAKFQAENTQKYREPLVYTARVLSEKIGNSKFNK